MKRRKFAHKQDMGKYLDAYQALYGALVEPKSAARLKTQIVDDALRGRISYQAAERLIARYHLESK